MALVPTSGAGSYRDDDEPRAAGIAPAARGAFAASAPMAEPAAATAERKPSGAAAVFAGIREREIDARQALPDDVKADPDAAARARKAAKFTGTSPIAIERNLSEFDQRQRISTVESAMRESERMRRWFVRDGAARVSHDDVPALKSVASKYDEASQGGWLPWFGDQLSKLVTTTVDVTSGKISQGRIEAAESGSFAADAAKEEGFFDRIGSLIGRGNAAIEEGLLNALAQTTGSQRARRAAEAINKGIVQAPIAGATSWKDVKGNPWNVGAYVIDAGAESLPYMITAAAGLPGLAAVATAQSGNIAAERAENNGKLRSEANIWDFITAAPYGTASAVLDRLGIEAIFAGAGRSAARRIGGAAAGEAVTEFAQSGIEYAGGTLGTDAGFDWREGLEQSIAGAIAGGPMGGAIRSGVEITTAASARVVQYAQARASERLIDDIFRSAEKSKLRLRDPELFAEFMEAQAAGTPASNLYVNGDVLRSLFQDENGSPIDRGEGAIDFEDLTPDFWDQLSQADATGGDVVIPMARAAAFLAGTPEWEIIKNHSRVAPGGVTPAEARGLEADWAEVVEDMGRRAYAEAQADLEAEGPRARVYSEVLSQARQAGFTLNAARAYADLYAERYQARAQRLGGGTDAWQLFSESVAGIRQAMPDAVETYRRGDQMDVVINAMRNSAQPMLPSGEGLLDRIIRGGGVVDAGGDVRAMGGDRVRKGGYFGRPLQTLIRPADDNGQFDQNLSLDAWAQTLWEEGYFGPREERPDINELLDLIGDALRGEPVVPVGSESPAVEVNNALVQAADDLRNILENAGLDPETASRADIDAAMAAYQAAEPGAFGFEQLRDDIGWSPSRIRDLLSTYAYSDDRSRTKAMAVRMEPEQFLGLTVPDEYRETFEGQVTPLDAGRLADEIQPIFLNVAESDGALRVIGHEGRHRMAALRDAGIRSVPVVLKYEGGREREAVDTARLLGQQFIGWKVPLDEVKIRALEPISYGNRERLTAMFGEGRILFQGQTQGANDQGGTARGRIDFMGDGRAMITLFEGRDMSTLLHESGHLWLEELRVDARRGGKIAADWETTKAWMKRETALTILDDQPIPTEAHEAWARAMERYFMEGKAPTVALRQAFASFRAWLVRIYKRVTGLNVNLDDEVRQVFDRLIATDEAILLAQNEGADRALFADAAAAGMTDAEFAAYQALVGESRTEAYDRLLNKTMERVRIERTKEARDRRATIRLEVEREIRARPEWQAIDLLRGNAGVHMPVAKESVITRVGNDAWDMLPKGRPGFPTFTDNGFDADLVAERAGFASGHEMLTVLMGIGLRRAELVKAGDRRSVLDEAIDVETDRRMGEWFGDFLTDGSIEDEALEIIHTDAGAQRLAAEVRQLAKQSGDVPTPEDAIRDWAKRVVGEARVVDQASGAAVDRHRRAATKAARAAEQAYLAGDFQEAFRQKQRQQIANALFMASRDARDRVQVIGKRLDRYSKSRGYKGMAPEYLDRIHELLEQFDLRQRSETMLRERETFDKWAARQREMGIDVQIPERLTLLGDKHFTRMTYDEVVALDDAVESLANLGRQKMRLKLDKEERDLEEMAGQAVQNAVSLPTRPFDPRRNAKRNLPRELNASLVKIEFLADYLDAGDPNGVFNEVLVKGATRAANKLEELQRDVMDPLAKLYLEMPAKERRRFMERIAVPEFISVDPETRERAPTTFLRSELIAVALNVGNKSNLEKMLAGETKALEELLGEREAARYAWTESKVMEVLNRHLSESDWKFVETVWLQVNKLWPDIVATERELTGITPEKVEGRPVETRFGTIEGGYYPVVYDPNRSQMASNNADQEAADIFGGIGRHVGTPKGHTISRTTAAMPITFSLERVLFSHVKKVSTRIAYGRYVRDTMKFVGHPKIRKLFDDHVGMEYHRQIKPWLSEQVQDASMDMKHLAALDRILRQFRVNMTMVGLGFRFTTMMAQISGWHNSQAEIGTKWLLRGIREMARDMGSIRNVVFEKSPELAGRAQAFDRDVRLFYQQAAESGRMEGDGLLDRAARAGDALGVKKVQAAAFWGIGMIDVYMVAMPTWLGAYHKAIDGGMAEQEAIDFADKAVRKSQSAGRAKDLSAVQRGPEGIRVLTTFYSYFNVLYNKQFETASLIKRGTEAGRRGDKAGKFDHWRQAAMNVWWIMLLAPVTSALLTGDLPDEDERDLEGLTAWAMSRIFFGLWAGVPGIRDIASRAQRKIDGEYAGNITSPFFTAFDAAERPLADLFAVLQGDEPSERWIKNAITAPGYFLGLPTGQPATTIQYLVDVAEGDQKPETAGDVAKGVIKGPQEDQE